MNDLNDSMASWFNNPDLADCELKVTTEVFKSFASVAKRFRARKSPLFFLKSALGPGPSEQATKTYPAHKLVLKSSCRLFRDQGGEEVVQGNQYYFTIAKEDEFPAAEMVIKYMYKIDLEPELTLQQLLQVLAIAEKYEVYKLPALCVKRIRTILTQSPTWADVLVVLDYMSHPTLKGLLDPALKSARGAVLERFLDLEESWAVEAERACFLQLPLEIVQWLMSNPDLKVASENTVAVVIGTWLLDSDKSVDCTDLQKQELWKLVRGGSLGSYFLSYVIPSMPSSLGLCPTSTSYANLVRARTTAAGPRPATAATADVFKGPRPASNRAAAILILSVPASELAFAFDKLEKTGSPTEFATNTEYFNGFFWTGLLKLCNTTEQYRQYDKHFVALRVATDNAGTPCTEDRFVTFSVSSPGHNTRNAVRSYRRSTESPLLGYFGFLGSDWLSKAVDGMVAIHFECKGLD